MTEARESAAPHARHAPGTPCWVSLMAPGMTATQKFYGALFGWEFRPGPHHLGPCVRALLDGHEVAAIGQLSDHRLPTAWTPYFASDDVDLTAETVRLCGGTVGVGPLEAEDAGRLVIGSDPSGAVFGVRQTATRRATSLAWAPGTPVWHELVTFETASVVKFYETVFGYEEEPVTSADFDHITLRLADRPVVGVHGAGHTLPHDRGPHWRTYFEVSDTDEATALLADLGGHVLEPPHASVHGRAATVADPEGALFCLIHRVR